MADIIDGKLIASEIKKQLINKIQEQINESRKQKERDKKQKEITDLGNKIAYLSMDTSGGNSLELLELEKQLMDKA